MPSSAKWIVLVNPCAGGGRYQKKIHALFKRLQSSSIDFEWLESLDPESFQELAIKAWQKGSRHFAIVGGDGTVNALVNCLLGLQNIELESCLVTVFPIGTGNDWAAYYGIDKEIDAFIGRLQTPQIKRQDIGKVGYKEKGSDKLHYFVNLCGAGFDSYVLESMGSASGQRWSYFLTVLKCLVSHKAPNLDISIDNEQHTFKSMLLLACLGRQGGAGMLFAPDADIKDGFFKVVCVQDMPFLKKLFSLHYLFNGKVNQHPKIKTWSSRALKINAGDASAGNVKFQCDGEVIGSLPIDIDIMPSALYVAV